MNNPLDKISEQDMLESLSRSGYLLESETTKRLVDYGLFVEPNIMALDPLTGKSREIDLVAEYQLDFDPERSKNKTVAFTRFVFEIKNNNAPLVLLTKFADSPNSEIYDALKMRKTVPKGLESIFYLDFYEVLFNEGSKNLFTQYCSFSKKKNEELMAHHPENIYSALAKIANYCEEATETDNEEIEPNNGYLRNFLYLPVVLIKDDLYELEIVEDDKHKLTQVDCSHLVFNYHFNQRPCSSIIYFITTKGLEEFLKVLHNAGKEVEKNMLEAKLQLLKKTPS
ncbi:MAG: hypothetical protein EOO90_06470 [Pedobacter sp.]|nr:MAG: hypothetical protein EOO90_06470 [Pedobacter sp.]